MLRLLDIPAILDNLVDLLMPLCHLVTMCKVS